MKIIIKENEAGFLMKNGVFVKMLGAGKYRINRFLGYEVRVEEMKGELETTDIPYDTLCKDVQFAAATIRVKIPDHAVGLVYEKGVLTTYAAEKEYVAWNPLGEVEVKVISMLEPVIPATVTKRMLSVLPRKYYTTVCVGEGEVGLLYYNQILQKELTCGVYRFWNYSTEIAYRIVDTKRTELEVLGQEILTKDKVGIRLNLTCAYQILDPKNAAEKIGSLTKQLYSYVQMVIRELVGGYRLDEILEQKNQISEEIYASLKEGEQEFFVSFMSAGIKDIILPGEIRDIMNTVLVAEKEAQAKVITRREEVASTRSLLNTAKLMEDNKTLYRLKELEYLERICDRVGEISVSGNTGLVEQLGKMFGVKQIEE